MAVTAYALKYSRHPLCAMPCTWGQGYNSKSDLIPALEVLRFVGD